VLSDDPFPSVDVVGWVIVEEETSGATPKLWLAEPDTDPEVHWLFKAVTVKDDHVHGEDWAEKAASHLGALLRLPCATVELARWNALDGCISRNLRPQYCQMQPGRAQLEKYDAPDMSIEARERIIRATRSATSGLSFPVYSRPRTVLSRSTDQLSTFLLDMWSSMHGSLTRTVIIITGRS